ncbi:hypothetical protein GCM10022251_45280 [Phytohabitans flavus]|uniref:Ceramidase n=1 Tax=Phytohabitans flavus TaxID=1076124 RepID=A0A6F8XTC9_9ACTN|nr:ceramidase domain-containing protein [Phytohabitans flavus]BCB77049.1 hypothetical protein Pflav_034590 [Phytohabitans flavus]
MYVDAYCERTGPGLAGEPLNAVSNLAFLAASALLLWLLAGRPRRAPVSVWLLPVMLGVVGLCSLAFHTVADSLTGALDTLSIMVFVLTAVVVVTHWTWGVRWRWAWLVAPVFLAFAIGLNVALAVVGGERATVGGYLPALVGLFAFGVAAYRKTKLLIGASALFAVSLTLRTLDGPLCGQVPVGTHFLWHCLNATVLFLVSLAVVRRWQDYPGSGSPASSSASASSTRP